MRLGVEGERRHHRGVRHGRSLAYRRVTVLVVITMAALLSSSSAQATQWEPVSRDEVVEVEARPRPGSAIRQLRARGVMPAAPHVVNAVLAAVDRYPEFMPYVKEARILGVDGATTSVYQRLAFGLVGLSDRDYVIDITQSVETDRQGRPIYGRRWLVGDSARVPERPSTVRLSVNRGYWRLTPDESGPTATRATYCLFTDPGGALPTFIVNQANTVAIRKVFSAVIGATADPRYTMSSAPLPEASSGTSSAVPPDGTCDDL